MTGQVVPSGRETVIWWVATRALGWDGLPCGGRFIRARSSEVQVAPMTWRGMVIPFFKVEMPERFRLVTAYVKR